MITAPTATRTTTVYLVAWTGDDNPSFASFVDLQQARETYEAWASAAHDRTDHISLVEQVIRPGGVVTNLAVASYCPATQENPAH